jgi:hypothetical protein
VPPSGRVIVPTMAESTPDTSTSFVAVVSGGHCAAHSATHVDTEGSLLSWVNR